LSELDDLRKLRERYGLKLGTQGLHPRPAASGPAPAQPLPPRGRIEDWVAGQPIETAFGTCFLAEARYGLAQRHGELPLGALLEHQPIALAPLAGEMPLTAADFRQLAFLDTETTGLAGGTGTYAFLVGLGVFEDGEFVIRQYFMRDIPEEGAMLSLVRQMLEPRTGLITFNGRAFDWPLLETRFAMNRQAAPAVGACHLDLLLPARRLWRLRLQSCALSSLEEHVLGVQRGEDDVPGWAIPGLYRDYLAFGSARPLRKVFYHNAHDILSLATLAAWLCQSLREPLQALQHAEDLFSLGRQMEAQGNPEMAAQLYERCLRCQAPARVRREAAHRLSHLHRRAGEAEKALALWHSLAERGDLQACLELAKHYEHRLKDLPLARTMARRALALLHEQRYPDRRKLAEVERRLARLEAKEKRRRGDA